MTPFSPFDRFNAPLPSYQLPGGGIGGGLPQNQPAQPFVWGQGGARLSPEQVLARQEMARDQMTADFSPVGSIWEGLGRVVNNVTGALESRKLDKAAAGANAERTASIAQLLGQGGNPALISALGSNDPVVQALAADTYKASLKQTGAKNLPDVVELQMIADDPTQTANVRKTALDRITAMNDPIVNVSLGGRDFAGPRSLFLGKQGKGGDPFSQPSGGAETAPPPPGGFMTLGQFDALRAVPTFKEGHPAWNTPVQITGDSDFDLLPAGKTYVGPDGVVRRK